VVILYGQGYTKQRGGGRGKWKGLIGESKTRGKEEKKGLVFVPIGNSIGTKTGRTSGAKKEKRTDQGFWLREGNSVSKLTWGEEV